MKNYHVKLVLVLLGLVGSLIGAGVLFFQWYTDKKIADGVATIVMVVVFYTLVYALKKVKKELPTPGTVQFYKFSFEGTTMAMAKEKALFPRLKTKVEEHYYGGEVVKYEVLIQNGDPLRNQGDDAEENLSIQDWDSLDEYVKLRISREYMNLIRGILAPQTT